MEINNAQAEHRRQAPSNSKKILFIIAIYLILTLSSKFNQTKDNSTQKLVASIKTQSRGFGLNILLGIFENDQVYEGQWSQASQNVPQSGFLTEDHGKFQIKITNNVDAEYSPEYKVRLSLLNGDYIDKGVLEYAFVIKVADWTSEKIGADSVSLILKREAGLQADFSKDKIFHNIDGGRANITGLNFTFRVDGDQSLIVQMDLLGLQASQHLVLGEQEHKILKMLIFAGVMFIVSYLPFSAVMRILRDIYEERDRASSYSLATLTITTMWDAVLCIVAFIYAFKDQESLILFIMPAFLLCLLFTNLEIRLMMYIYQAFTAPGDFRRIACKFNLLTYGCLMLAYPILLITNCNELFFLGISCIIFPQIYVNGQTGNRPNPNNAYYTRFLLVRFAIIFYLRCFPLNAFGFKPDYILSLCCIGLIALQYALLHIQKVYGSKMVIPSFLLEPVFNYKFEEQINIEEGTQQKQCVICLNPLHLGPAQGESAPKQVNFKLMSTPCNHVYHSQCLIQWMKIKMECPQCRNKLPPFQ